MKKHMALSLLLLTALVAQAQEPLTKEQILNMTTDELTELPLDELMAAVETLGVTSVDELFAMIMNKGVSSASKDDESVFTSPMATTVITGAEMRSYGCTTIEEAMRLVPGAIVQERYNGVFDVHLRGLNSIPDNNMILYTENSNILVMIDGRISHNYAMGVTNFEFLPISIEDIDRIEVIRGAASALYGPNAVQGVVNIITIKPDTDGAKARGYAQAGNNTTTADIGLRRMFGEHFAMGVTANFQERRRPTEDIRLIPQNDIYVVTDKSVFDHGTTLGQSQVNAALKNDQMYSLDGSDIMTYTEDINLYNTMHTQGVDTLYDFFTMNPQSQDPEEVYNEAKDSRRSYGVNAYLSVIPNPNGRIDISGGFQKSRYYTTSPGNDHSAMRMRDSRTGYGYIQGRIHGLTINFGYADGMQDFSTGTDGFRMQRTANLQAAVDYDFRLKCGLSIRPAFAYQYQLYKDEEPRYVDLGDGRGPVEMNGYFGLYSRGENYAEMWSASPSLRLDYRVGPWRLVAAYRADKTKIPDKWNHSGQGIVSVNINDNHFLRLGYGRAFRSAAVVNTQSNYRWSREGMSPPNTFQFLGNTDAPLVHIDNYEVGYRCQPSPKLLVDAEAFFSQSTDYGALKSYNTVFRATGDDLRGVLGGAIQLNNLSMSLEEAMQIVASAASTIIDTKTYLKYDALPYKVQQMGISANVDWIVSPKVILKINANVQRTKIDKYYQYSQPEAIANQLAASGEAMNSDVNGLVPLCTDIFKGVLGAMLSGGNPYDYIGKMMIKADIDQIYPGCTTWSQEKRNSVADELMQAFLKGEGTAECPADKTLGAYYGMRYGVRYDKPNDEYEIGGAYHEEPQTVNNHKHKATPAFYGMVGVVFKPIEKLSGSASVNWMTAREYTTNYGTEKLSPRCTVNLKVAYKPIEQVELFVNLRNLLNTNKREFIYTDPIGGSYMAGVSLAF